MMAWSVGRWFLLVCVCCVVTILVYACSLFHHRYFNFREYIPRSEVLYWPAEELQKPFELNKEELSIAISAAIRLQECPGLTVDNAHSVLAQEPLLVDLIPSFCVTASQGYMYYMYLAYDYNDPCLYNDNNVAVVTQHVVEALRTSCSKNMSIMAPRLIRCSYYGRPSWAQNDAVMSAYWHNISYFYRVNDDTKMMTPRWSEAFVSLLNTVGNVGVVGPTHTGGNTRILTHEFTHRTHVDIFGFYYPTELTDWYGDSWITSVYRSKRRMAKLANITLAHTKNLGTRYQVSFVETSFLKQLECECAKKLSQWLEHREMVEEHTDADDVACSNVVSFKVTSSCRPAFMQALRNVIAVKTLLPSRWCARIFVPDDTNVQYKQLLEQYGAQVRSVTTVEKLTAPVFNGTKVMTSLELHQWQQLSMFDKTLGHVVVKSYKEQLSMDTAREIILWEASKVPLLSVSGIEGTKIGV